jgi:hypothetical protein
VRRPPTFSAMLWRRRATTGATGGLILPSTAGSNPAITVPGKICLSGAKCRSTNRPLSPLWSDAHFDRWVAFCRDECGLGHAHIHVFSMLPWSLTFRSIGEALANFTWNRGRKSGPHASETGPHETQGHWLADPDQVWANYLFPAFSLAFFSWRALWASARFS